MKSFVEALSDNSKAALARHQSHFPSGAELSIQVLKGHLLVEELVRELVRARLPHNEALEGESGASFTCHQMICLAQAIAPNSDALPWIWRAAKKLNNIRNKLAHRLDYAVLKKDVETFTSYCVREQPDIKVDMEATGIPPDHLFESCVMSVSTALVAFRG